MVEGEDDIDSRAFLQPEVISSRVHWAIGGRFAGHQRAWSSRATMGLTDAGHWKLPSNTWSKAFKFRLTFENIDRSGGCKNGIVAA